MGLYREFVLTSSGLTTATTAYTSGDVLGGQMTMDMNIRGSGPIAGCIKSVVISDSSAVIGAVDLFFYNASTTPAADNAAYAPSDAEVQTLVGVLSAATQPVTGAGNKIATLSNLEQDIPFYAPTGALYVVAVTRSANAVFAAGSTSLQYRLMVEQE